MAKILLVDDEPDIVFLVKRILERGGHEVVEAYGGEEALKLTEEEKPDLILLDIMMPDINGWEVSKTIKSSKRGKDLPIVMLTVRTSADSVQRSSAYAQADAHIGKPASGKEILTTVNNLVANLN